MLPCPFRARLLLFLGARGRAQCSGNVSVVSSAFRRAWLLPVALGGPGLRRGAWLWLPRTGASLCPRAARRQPPLDASCPPSPSLLAPRTRRPLSPTPHGVLWATLRITGPLPLLPAFSLRVSLLPSLSSFSPLGSSSACTHGFHRLLRTTPGLTRAGCGAPDIHTPCRSLFLPPTPPAARVSLNGARHGRTVDQLRGSESPAVTSAPSLSPLWPLRFSPKWL